MAKYITNLPLNNIFGITSAYKQVNTKLWKTYHKGMDFVGSDDVYSVCNGTVKVIGWDEDGWGRYVTIEPTGFPELRFIFAHFEKNGVKVKVGDKVTRTTIIGKMGSTGNSTGKHLHIELRHNNVDVDISKYLGIPNKIATNLNANNFKVNEENADDFLRELTKTKCTECEKLSKELETLKAENTELKNCIKNIKNLIAKWS